MSNYAYDTMEFYKEKLEEEKAKLQLCIDGLKHNDCHRLDEAAEMIVNLKNSIEYNRQKYLSFQKKVSELTDDLYYVESKIYNYILDHMSEVEQALSNSESFVKYTNERDELLKEYKQHASLEERQRVKLRIV